MDVETFWVEICSLSLTDIEDLPHVTKQTSSSALKFVSKFKVINVKETKSEFKKGDLFLNICKDVTVSLEVRNKD